MRQQVQKLAFELQVRGLMKRAVCGEKQRSLPD
ncbi:Uncharacterised protein [Escherichia coli]|uniref:Uncharacterized protein n=1 Tax=Escherichia coli TaxID=562 RepID=A0A376RPB3_ECOLX|nr:Uncharacterised protein [Escherichia coli]